MTLRSFCGHDLRVHGILQNRTGNSACVRSRPVLGLTNSRIRRKANALFDDQATIQLFSDLDVKPETIGDDGMQIWRTEFHGISMVLFTLDSVVQVVRFRVPSQNGFSIMEGIPISRQRESGESLLPRCDGVSQLGVRRNPVGGESVPKFWKSKLRIKLTSVFSGRKMDGTCDHFPVLFWPKMMVPSGTIAAKETRSLRRLSYTTRVREKLRSY